jgi:transposase
MINPIGLNRECRLQSLLNRPQCAKLWRFCHNNTKSGIVTLLIPEILLFFNISRSTLYNWLKEGKKLGMFRYYKKTGKFTLYIVLGGKKAVTEKLGLTDWGAVVEKPLEEILIKKEDQLRQQTTLHHAQWLEMKSRYAAKAALTKEYGEKPERLGKRFKPYQPKFSTSKPVKKSIGKPVPKTKCGATTIATPPNKQPSREETRRPNESDQGLPKLKIKKVAFARNHTPIGSSQEAIAKKLGVSVRTVTRHLAKTESVQVMYKVTDPDEIKRAEAEIYYAIEEGKTPRYFVREGEIYRFGNSLYNLNETLKSEFTQRVKYKFNLFKKIARLEIFKDKNSLLYYLFKGKSDPNSNGNYDQDELFKDFRELFNGFNLDHNYH